MLVDARIPDSTRVVISAVRSIKNVSVETRFECLNIHDGPPSMGTLAHFPTQK